MEAAAHLSLVQDTGLLVDPSTGEPVDTSYRIRDLEDRNSGLVKTIEQQAKRIGSLERRIEVEENPEAHPKGAEIVGLIERWKRGARPKAKTSGDRVKLVKARLKESYTVEDLELAIDGLCAFPFRRYDDRLPAPSAGAKRDDELEVCLKKGARVEMFARLGWEARKQGRVTWA